MIFDARNDSLVTINMDSAKPMSNDVMLNDVSRASMRLVTLETRFMFTQPITIEIHVS